MSNSIEDKKRKRKEKKTHLYRTGTTEKVVL